MENLDVYDLILRLGSLGAYDSSRRIKGADGQFVENTDIAHLIEEAMRPSRVVNGSNAFIDLLVASKIKPETIANDNIRAKLIQKLQQQSMPSESESTNESLPFDNDDDDDATVISDDTANNEEEQGETAGQEVEDVGIAQQNVIRLERADVNNHPH